ncbi:hypothetical protein GCM10022225_42120 [Plantactinospora mayteni]|uniref:Uncharacterized protein n=2 Tax=Plantactinospora mayteni TaxID=566021 RepID=A0ABQ4EUB5_9ACTN|nr:hypothetical protein Pma05_48090 [Plantactinospora mayteni]
MKRETLLLLIAGALLAAGLLIGYVPVHSSSGQDCGSPFASNVKTLRLAGSLTKLGGAYSGNGYGDLGFGDAVAECEAKHNGTRPIAILLLALGGTGMLAGFVGYTVTRRQNPSAQAPFPGG